MSSSGGKKIEVPVDNSLEEAKAFIENLCNQKIKEINDGAVDFDNVTFEDFKIKAADVPQENLPGSSKDMNELVEQLKDSNDVLYKAWNDYLESKKKADVVEDPIIAMAAERSKEKAEEKAERKRLQKEEEDKIREPAIEVEKIDPSEREPVISGVKAEQIDSREKELLDALADARNQFADIEYRDRTAMQRIRKAMGMQFDEKGETPNIVTARKSYEDALGQYMEYQVDKLQASGYSKKILEAEVKKLYSFFNLQETLQYYDARTQAKMEYLAEKENKSSAKKTWDAVRLKSAQISEWYNKKVPLSIKLGLAAAAFIPGASAFALGKRTWGAFMLVAAGGMQLDKLAQLKDRIADKREAKKEFENISGKDGSVDFEKLKGILGEKISNIDDKLNSKNLRSGANKFVAFAGAMFLGGSAVKGAMDLLEAKLNAVDAVGGNGGVIPDKPFDPSNVNAGVPPTENIEKLDFDSSNVKDGVPVEDFDKLGTPAESGIGNGASGVVVSAVENADSATEAVKEVATENLPATMEKLVIEKGSSFEGTLIKYLSDSNAEIYKYHPELQGKDPGWIAHRLALDFASDHNTEMPDLVHPGAEIKINFDPAALKLEGGFEETIRIDLTDSVDAVEAKKDIVSSIVGTPDDVANISGEDLVQEMDKVVAPEDYVWPNKQPVIMDDVRIDGMDDGTLKEIAEYNSEEQDYFINGIKETPDVFERFINVVAANRKEVCGGNFKLYSQIRNLNFLKNQEDIMEKLPKAGKKAVQNFMKEVPLKKIETFDQWMRRVSRFLMEKYK